MGTLGCDYSTKKIWLALVHGSELLETRELNADVGVGQLYSDLQWAFAAAMLHHGKQGATKIRVEAPIGFVNYRTTTALTRVAAFVEMAAETFSLPAFYVYPGTWRKAVLGTGTRIKSKDQKQKSLETAKMMWPKHEFKDHNEAEAALIALYGEGL